MTSKNELKDIEPFRSLGPTGKKLLSHGSIVKQSKRSAAILHKGQSVSGVYVVISGRLRVFTMTPNGTEATLYFIDPGEACVLSINCLFNDHLYPAWVQAESSTAVAVIPGSVYRKLFETEPVIQNLTVQALSTLVFRLMTELEQVHSSSHKQRLIQFILAQAASDGNLKMTQQQIARHLGTTREVIARLVRAFVAQGLIRTRRGSIAVRDLFALRGLIVPTSP